MTITDIFSALTTTSRLRSSPQNHSNHPVMRPRHDSSSWFYRPRVSGVAPNTRSYQQPLFSFRTLGTTLRATQADNHTPTSDLNIINNLIDDSGPTTPSIPLDAAAVPSRSPPVIDSQQEHSTQVLYDSDSESQFVSLPARQVTPPLTPNGGVLSPPSYEESQMRPQYSTPSSPSGQDRSHRILAQGEMLFDWDGVIPGRTTRGLRARKGQLVDICGFFPNGWVMAHDESCKYLPSQFVSAISSDSAQPLGPSTNAPKRTSTYKRIFSFHKNPSKKFLLKGLMRRLDVTSAGGIVRELQRPPVPPAPFPLEPVDQEHEDSRLIVSTGCEMSQEGSGAIVNFTFAMVPGPRSRFASLRFTVRSSSGGKLMSTLPEHVVDGTIGSAPEQAQLGGSSRPQSYAASPPDYNLGVQGEGWSNHVTWKVTEVNDRTGLPHKVTLSALLPPGSPPPNLRCCYELLLAGQRGTDPTSAPRKFSHSWDVDFRHEIFASAM